MAGITNHLDPKATDFEYNYEIANYLVTFGHNVILTNELVNLNPHQPSIVILTSDENHHIPLYHNHPNVLLVCKHHHIYRASYPNILEIPMGYCTGLRNNKLIPARERQYDFAYAGQYGCDKACNRGDLKRALENSNHPGNFLWYFSDRYAGGPGMEWYSDLIYDSKIFLAPWALCDVWYNDTTRFFDALRAGCVVMTKPLAKKWYTKNLDKYCAVINDWTELDKMVQIILEEIDTWQSKSIEYYNIISPQSVGNKINLYIQNRNYNEL